ncbi:hypothetical protein LW14_27750 [Rhizobium sp. H41]|nr:hypothetical protein LW14_27750 [Rhizobium sp. H41]
MKSIGEISIATTDRAGFREFSSCEERGTAQPQEPQHRGPKGRRDRLRPAPAHRLKIALPVNADETEAEVT